MTLFFVQEKPDPLENDPERADAVQMGRLINTASKLFELNHALQQLHSSLSRTLRGMSFCSLFTFISLSYHIEIFAICLHVDYSTGRGSDVDLRSFRDAIQSLTMTISSLVHGLPRQTDVCSADALQLPCLKSVMDARDDLHSALRSLAELFDERSDENEQSRIFVKAEIQEPAQGPRNRTVPKIVYSLSSGVSSCSRDVRWV